MNPFLIPKWGKKEAEFKKVDRPHLGVRNEAVWDDKDSEHHITIRVMGGVTGDTSGEYKLAYSEGTSLARYLSRLNLKRSAAYSAVYDHSNLENGRCRMTYVPKPGARIVIGHASVGSAVEHQRSNVDAQRLAVNMGGGAKVVEVKMRR